MNSTSLVKQELVAKMNCAGKTALVAGGLGGIGYATCKSLLIKGLKNLGIFDLIENDDFVKELVETYPNANIRFWKIDATVKSEIEDGFRAVLENFKSIDIFINSVGIIDEMRPEQCIAVNLLASVHLNYTAMDYMSRAKNGNGGIVANIASLAGLVPFPMCVVYSATKHGLIGLTRSLGTDFYYRTSGIKFIAICPGFTTTPLLNNFSGSLINDITELPEVPQQSTDICGTLLVEAIEKNVNGSIWLIDAGVLQEIIPPNYYDGPDGT